MNKRKCGLQLSKRNESIFATIADGLDATTDGRGWGLEHQIAKHLADAAPDLLAALEASMLDSSLIAEENTPQGLRARVRLRAGRAAIDKARSGGLA